MRRAHAAFAVLALTVGLTACGEAEEPAAPQTSTSASGTIELKVVYDDGEGKKAEGELSCGAGAPRATGALDGLASPATLCSRARELTDLLTTQPDKGRACTQIYGGPQTARITGSINGAEVDRRFTRTNGCEIADFDQVAGLLPR